MKNNTVAREYFNNADIIWNNYNKQQCIVKIV